MIEIKPNATAGIYAEVIKQIYDRFDKRIREAISNAYDARASKVVIKIFKDMIVIADDGEGMDESDLLNKYVVLGGGDNYENKDTIGRIGIGALSLFAIGDDIIIKTRKVNSENVITAHIDPAEVKRESKHNIPLSELKIGEIREARPANSGEEAHFTEITIRELEQQVKDIINDPGKVKEFIEVLEKVLPISYRDDDPLFHKVSPIIARKIKEDKYKIDVYISVPHLDINDKKLFRKSVYKDSRAKIIKNLPIAPIEIQGGLSSNLSIYGYLYINDEGKLDSIWQGINARVKNVAIEPNTYFGFDGDKPAMVRIGGEIFIENLDENHAIQSNRSGFATQNRDYRVLQEYIMIWLEESVKIIRAKSDLSSEVKKYVSKIRNLRDTLESIMSIQDTKEDADNFAIQNDKDIDIPDTNTLFSLEDKIREIMRKKNVGGQVTWSSMILDDFHIQLLEDNSYAIQVHDDIKKMKFDVGGTGVECKIGYFGPNRPFLCKKTGTFLVNLENSIIKNSDVLKAEPETLWIVGVLYLNYLRNSNNAQKLYQDTYEDIVT